jgi:hypothetical protein
MQATSRQKMADFKQKLAGKLNVELLPEEEPAGE